MLRTHVHFGDYSKGAIQTAEQIKAKNVPQCEYSIGHTDFLPLFIRSAVVADWNFVDDRIQLGNLCRHFNFNTESAGLDDHVTDDFASEGLVPGLDVRHIQVRQKI